MVLLDYPDSEGVTRELVIGYPRRLITGRPLLALAVAAVLALCAILGGRAVFRSAATGPAADVHLPVIPFPTASASTSPAAGRSGSAAGAPPLAGSPSPPLAVNLRDSQLTPSAAPGQATGNAAGGVPAVTVTPSPASTQQVVAVKYLVVGQADGGLGFEGEVSVVNEGSAPISGWQITVALPFDRITAIGGASGYVSNHILLMQPQPGSGPLEPGGQLRVVFIAQGTETTPQLCAFNNTACG